MKIPLGKEEERHSYGTRIKPKITKCLKGPQFLLITLKILYTKMKIKPRIHKSEMGKETRETSENKRNTDDEKEEK